MKNSKRLTITLLVIVLLQSAFFLTGFTTSEKDKTVNSYRIEKKYLNGMSFYVLISNGEAKAFIKE